MFRFGSVARINIAAGNLRGEAVVQHATSNKANADSSFLNVVSLKISGKGRVIMFIGS